MSPTAQHVQPPRKAVARSLFPREHGAYAQLGLPLLAALAGSRPTLASALFALSALSAFVGHEALLVVTGVRGTRLRREEGPRARRWGAILGGAALALGALGLVLSRPEARQMAALALVAAAMLLPFVLRHAERSTAGEIVAGFALAGAAAPVAAAGGIDVSRVVVAWAGWGVAFAATTLVVRSLVHRGASPRAMACAPALLLALGAGLASAHVVSPALALAPAPIALACIVVALAAPPPARLRTVGWALAGTTTLTALLFAVALRA